MRLGVLALTLFSTPAFAAPSLDKLLGSIGTATLGEDIVEVPLFSGPMGETQPHVQVQIGGKVYLFGLLTSQSEIWVSEQVIKDQEITLKPKNKKLINLCGDEPSSNRHKWGIEVELGDLSELHIGAMSLNAMEVIGSKLERDEQDSLDENMSQRSSVGVDGYIGLEALPANISWAVLPSEGVVRFSRQALSIEAGMTLQASKTESELKVWGKKSAPFDVCTPPPVLGWDPQVLVQGITVGGVAMPATLELGYGGSHYRWPTTVPSESVWSIGDIEQRLLEVSVESTPLGTEHLAGLTALDGAAHFNRAVIGQDILAGFDVVADRAGGTLTLKKAAVEQRADPLPFMIAEATKAIASESEGVTEPSVTADEKQEETPVKGAAADWARLQDLYTESKQFDTALQAAQNRTILNGRDCEDWMALASAQTAQADFAGAIVSYEKASELFHAWYDLSLEERQRIKKDLAKLNDAQKQHADHYVADESCHLSDGRLAAATFAAGDVLTIEKLYRERLDLDPKLALLAGNALITRGELVHAHEPLRQALKFGGAQPQTRLSLGVLYAEQGDWKTASALFERANVQILNVQSLLVWLKALEASQGVDAALAQAKSLVKTRPHSAAAHVALAYRVASGDNGPLKAKTRKASERFFMERLKRYPRYGELAGQYARWLNQWEPGSAAAQSAAERALDIDGSSSNTFIALAEVYEAQGHVDQARKWTMGAAQSAPLNIGYARLFTQ